MEERDRWTNGTHGSSAGKWRTAQRVAVHEPDTDLAARLEAGGPVDWAGLAATLGYADQAHLSRDFADLFGEPPTWYARRYPPA